MATGAAGGGLDYGGAHLARGGGLLVAVARAEGGARGDREVGASSWRRALQGAAATEHRVAGRRRRGAGAAQSGDGAQGQHLAGVCSSGARRRFRRSSQIFAKKRLSPARILSFGTGLCLQPVPKAHWYRFDAPTGSKGTPGAHPNWRAERWTFGTGYSYEPVPKVFFFFLFLYFFSSLFLFLFY